MTWVHANPADIVYTLSGRPTELSPCGKNGALPARSLRERGTGAGDVATDIIRKAMDHYRGLTSYSEMTMTIHRPDWERSMTMRPGPRGEAHAGAGGGAEKGCR